MSRTIPAAVRVGLEREASPDALLAFMTITHANLAEPIRVVSDVIDYVWDGATYTGLPFEVAAVTDEDGPPTTQIRVQNTDRRIGEAIRSTPERAMISLAVLSSADFDLTQEPRVALGTPATVYAFQYFELVDVSADVVEITARVFLRDYTQEQWPGISATQSRCPGLFR